jgi:hypothetical protein
MCICEAHGSNRFGGSINSHIQQSKTLVCKVRFSFHGSTFTLHWSYSYSWKRELYVGCVWMPSRATPRACEKAMVCCSDDLLTQVATYCLFG